MLHLHQRNGAPHARTFSRAHVISLSASSALSSVFLCPFSRRECSCYRGPRVSFLVEAERQRQHWQRQQQRVSVRRVGAQFHLQPGFLDALIMYTVSKGPSKIVAKTRRGINQNLERLENLRDLSRKSDHEEDTSEEDKINRNVPKPVFYTNGKLKPSLQRHRTRQEVITPQHEELIKFVCDSWNQINARQRCSSSDDSEEYECSSNETIVYYNDGEPNHVLQDFKPFDLESWWGKRLFNNITKSL